MLELPGRVVIESDRDLLYDRLVAAMSAAADEAIEQRGVFHLALPGGTTPEPLYLHMVIDPRFRLFPWPRTHVWQTDEQAVPPDDDRCNAKLLRESLIDHVTMGRAAFHPMPALDDDGPTWYGRVMEEELGGGGIGEPPRLDFALLGLGTDGHVASLFPGSPAVEVRDQWAVRVDAEHADPPRRMTLTLPVISAARHVAILATGEHKADILRRVSRQAALGPAPKSLPVTGVRPARGRLTWYLDADAAPGIRL